MKRRLILHYKGDAMGGDWWFSTTEDKIVASKALRSAIANVLDPKNLADDIKPGSQIEFVVVRADLKK